jgi:KUP system potassium uptake protein
MADSSVGGASHHGSHDPSNRALLLLCLGALGVVFGDIGTSPLYTMSEIFFGHAAIPLTPQHVLGATSLIVWGLILIVTIKYVVFVLRADHAGEGGGFALLALLTGYDRRPVPGIRIALVFAAGLLYGEGIITPAISVLSAVEGIKLVTHGLDRIIVPVTAAILIVLFAVQRGGTARVGALFGPVVMLWFIAMGVLGGYGVAHGPAILGAINPWHAIAFLYDCGPVGAFGALGSALLAITGCEALYADMGHVGRRAIRLSWLSVAFPSLVLIYLGQGAWLLSGQPVSSENVFYSMVPSWGLFPMVMLATSATIIASQALITGAFSVTRQAIALGLFPRVAIVHTSGEHMGQVYLPAINFALMAGCLMLVFTFESSTALAAAYGFAVCGVMTITSISMWMLSILRWNWSRFRAAAVFGPFLLIDLLLLSSASLKFPQGGWVPFLVGLATFGIMTTWKWGRRHIAEGLREVSEDGDTVGDLLLARREGKLPQAQRSIVVMTSRLIDDLSDRLPPVLQTFHERFGITPRHIIFLTVVQEPVPKVKRSQRYEVHTFCRDQAAGSVVSVRMHYGYMDSPNIRRALFKAKEQHQIRVPGDPRRWLVLVGQENLIWKQTSAFVRARLALFKFMLRNSVPAHLYFGLGADSGVITETIHIRLGEPARHPAPGLRRVDDNTATLPAVKPPAGCDGADAVTAAPDPASGSGEPKSPPRD